MVMMSSLCAGQIAAAKRLEREKGQSGLPLSSGSVLRSGAVNRFATQQSLILIAGRYEGIDERLIDAEVDEEWSIGDYVLSGGELPAMVLMDALNPPDTRGSGTSRFC